jgi:hypothetical protein
MPDMTQNTTGPGRPPSEFSGERAASRALEDAKQMAGELFTTMRDSASDLLGEQRRRVADEIEAIGQTLRQSGEALDRDAGIAVGRYADEAARAVTEFAENVRDRSWTELAADLGDVARRWPYSFLAAAFAAGFVGGRLLLSAPPRDREPGLSTAMPDTAVTPTAETGTATRFGYVPVREED